MRLLQRQPLRHLRALSKMKAVKDKKVLITGGSSGMGLELAKLFYADGADVTLLARDAARLASAKAQIEQTSSLSAIPVGTLSADVSNVEALYNALSQYKEDKGTPDFLINSAGMSRPGYAQEIPLEVYDWLMQLNYIGTVNVIKYFLQDMIDRRSGHIINFSSLAGIVGVFGYTAYSASKFAVRGFSDALRSEMKPYGINLSVIYPPDTDTPQLVWEKQYKPFETSVIAGSDKPLPVKAVVDEIYRGVRKNKYVIVPGSEAKLLHWAATHLGGLVYPIVDFLVADAQRKKSKQG